MRVIVATIAAFLVIVGIGFLRLWIFLRRSHIRVRQGEKGTALHIETPAGKFDLEPRDGLDPQLASFVIYPGAQLQLSAAPEYVATAERRGGNSKSLAATCWTADLSGKVLEYYRTVLPHWRQTREWLGDAEHAWEFTDTSDPMGARTIRVRARYGGTEIENIVELDRVGNDGQPP